MYISGGNDRLNCKLFPSTLRGGSHVLDGDPTSLVPSVGESLESYLARFNNATVWVDNPDQKFFVKAF
ncbi:hypothetical protein CR513_61522, partial [Mucuna pruriens]